MARVPLRPSSSWRCRQVEAAGHNCWRHRFARNSASQASAPHASTQLPRGAVAPVIPGGDEPHYLIISAEPAHRRRSAHREQPRAPRLPVVRPADLKPDYLRRGRDGAIYSIHAPGLAVLVLPAFALGGYFGVTIFLVLISAAGAF
jgi:hypothetical protein